jgi:hypothetical protein
MIALLLNDHGAALFRSKASLMRRGQKRIGLAGDLPSFFWMSLLCARHLLKASIITRLKRSAGDFAGTSSGSLSTPAQILNGTALPQPVK